MAETREISNVVGANLKRLREAQRLNQRDFAKWCTENGWSVTASTIENIEGVLRTRNGMRGLRREISVDELVWIARMFNVEPARLLNPLRVRTALVIEDDLGG